MIETLGDAHQQSVTLTMRCAWGRRDGLKSVRECAYQINLDMPTLIATRGKDMPLSLLTERLRCPRCGSRRVRLLYHFPTNTGSARAS